MSNYLAIATVTAAMKQMVQEAVNVIGGAEVKLGRPENQDKSFTGAYLYMYKVTPNAAMCNQDLPTRDSDGALIQRPQSPLDLHYLISFYGDETRLAPQRLMGGTVSALLAQPILTRERILEVTNPAGGFPYLAQSDLSKQVESIKFSQAYLNTEDFSRLWSVFMQVPLHLSVFYQASVVILEPELSVQKALPAAGGQSHVSLAGLPVISDVEPPVVVFDKDASVELKGRHLWDESAHVLFGGLEGKVTAHTERSIRVELPPGLPAGINSVHVEYHAPGQPPTRIDSNEKQFVLQPRVDGAPAYQKGVDPTTGKDMQTFTVKISPAVQPHQQVELLLNQMQAAPGEPAAAYGFASGSLTGVTPGQPLDTLVFKVQGVTPGRFLVRIRLDQNPQSESPLTVDAAGAYSGPMVVVT